MDKDIGVGLIIGLLIASTLFVYNTKIFSQPQKVFLYICVIFPPLQWLSILILLAYNYFQKELYNNNSKHNTRDSVAYDSVTQLSNLNHLRDEGILTDEEYFQKQEIIMKAELSEEMKRSDDYKKLKDLYESGILTKEEFDAKLETLRLKLNNLRQKQKEEEKLGFTVTEEISEGYFVIRDDDFNYGYANQQMNKVIDTVYDHAESFKEGIALVRYNGKFGFINKKNEAVIPFLYDNADSFKGGVAKVRKGKEVFYINIKGERQL
ncbi:WG repeat-containing protein [Winogradskyella sp.]|uniref:WG repeat-containing protein n=1 Tax=Winogradskyella sp. TaxID=1883156 RepID=UPI003AB69FCC